MDSIYSACATMLHSTSDTGGRLSVAILSVVVWPQYHYRRLLNYVSPKTLVHYSCHSCYKFCCGCNMRVVCLSVCHTPVLHQTSHSPIILVFTQDATAKYRQSQYQRRQGIEEVYWKIDIFENILLYLKMTQNRQYGNVKRIYRMFCS